MKQGNKKVLVVLPTGAGKTICFAWMASKAQAGGKVVWFLVHRQELLEQTHKTFNALGLELSKIYVGMVGQVANNAGKFPEPDLIIFDEGHHAAAATWRKITARFPNAWLVGLTATPARLDGKPLGEIYNDLLIGPTAAELIECGFLSNYKYMSVQVADLKGLKRRGADFDLESAEQMLMSKAIYGDVIATYKEEAKDKQAVCFCATIKHSKAMAAEFNEAGITAAHFDGNTKPAERRELIAQFRAGSIKVLCNCELIGEGFDMPSCDAAILLRPTQSLTIYLQQVGRALRPREGKTALILDHVGNYLRHGLPDDERSWSLERKLVEQPMLNADGSNQLRMCTECLTVYKSAQGTCPYCGAEYEHTAQELEQMESVRLAEIKRTIEDRQQVYKERRSSELNSEHDCRSYMDLFLYAQKCKHDNPKRYATSRSYALGFKLPWEKQVRRKAAR